MSRYPRYAVPLLLGHIETEAAGQLRVLLSYYQNERIAIVLQQSPGVPWATMSVNVPNEPIGESEFFVKAYNENQPMREPLLASGLFVDTGLRLPRGFVELELWRLAKPLSQTPA